MTAEYEYENTKGAVESAQVVIFMRIRHNVFTSLAADVTVYYVIGLYGTCGFKTIYIYIYVAHFTCSTHIVPYV